MLLAPNFPLIEFDFSQMAVLHGINNAMPVEFYPAARALCMNVLQPVRDHLGVPLSLSSAYRCQELERLLKKKPKTWKSDSQHTKGEAADILPPRLMTNIHLAAVFIDLRVPFDQLICEKPGEGWVHVSHRADGKNRMQVLSWMGGNDYRPGIVRP